MGKQTKVKNAKKVMAFFGLNFDLHPPYNVLVDPEIIHLALSRKVFIKEAIPELLRGKAHLVVTKCITAHLRKLGPDYGGAALMAKRLQHEKCGHEEAPVDPIECILSLLTEPKYCVAIQDKEARKKARAMAGVPIMFLSNNIVTLEKASNASERAQRLQFKALRKPSEREQVWLEHQDKNDGKAAKKGSGAAWQPRIQYGDNGKVKTRKAKGPNPLSVKKKKKKPNQQQQQQPSQQTPESKKRKREDGDEEKSQQREGGEESNPEKKEKKAPRKRRRVRVRKGKKKSETDTGNAMTVEEKV